jgi:hypothetical protein
MAPNWSPFTSRLFNTPENLISATMTQLPLKTIVLASVGSWAGAAFSHDGHGLAGLHGHATDAWGFVVLAALVATAVGLSRGGK